ncbi:unnamed protein product [Ectocarpus sp. CCAP 1310/34]|nr:unnamed protein product [Ectocarpus sp. CCAP 1310/34]
MDNGTEFINSDFRALLRDFNITAESTSADGVNNNGHVERRIALAMDGGRAAWGRYPNLFPGVEFPARAKSYQAMWPEIVTWMNDAVNTSAEARKKGTRSPEFKTWGARRTNLVQWYMMPGFRHHDRAKKMVSKGRRVVYLNNEIDHSPRTNKVLLPSGLVAYSSHVTFGYRRHPFVGEVPTWGSGAVQYSMPWASPEISGDQDTGAGAATPSPDSAYAAGASPTSSSLGRGLAAGDTGAGAATPHPGSAYAAGAAPTSSSPGRALAAGNTGARTLSVETPGGRVFFAPSVEATAGRSGGSGGAATPEAPGGRVSFAPSVEATAGRAGQSGGAAEEAGSDQVGDELSWIGDGDEVSREWSDGAAPPVASRTWHQHLVRGMKRVHFEQCLADACVMRLVEHRAVTMVVVVHVDDIPSIGRKGRCDQFGADLIKYVPISNLGELRWYAGCRFSRDIHVEQGTLAISQQAVAEKMVAKLDVIQNKSTLMAFGFQLDESDPAEPDVDEPFRSLVGHLVWLASQTRPNILNAMRAVARYAHAPKMLHWHAALHVLMYVRSTASYGITFSRGTAGGVELELYVDSDFASTATDRRSVSGAVAMCAGRCVSYLSRTQRSVTLSSTEAEYVALADGLKEGIFLRIVWSFIFPDNHVGLMTVKEDNQGALYLATTSDGSNG